MSNTVNKGSIFNVEEAQGTERAQYETTAAHAQAEAPNAHVAHEVEENAEHLQQAATKAAQAAQGMGSELTGERDTSTAFDVFKSEMAQKTNAAASEGQRDLHTAKNTSASYLDQAKTVVESIATSAQDYLHSSTDPQASNKPEGDAASSSSLQASASSAVETAQKYLASAQAAAQPHIDVARSTLQPQVEKARETAEGYLGMHSSTSPSGAVTPPSNTCATTGTPLVAGTQYASTITTTGADERELESTVA